MPEQFCLQLKITGPDPEAIFSFFIEHALFRSYQPTLYLNYQQHPLSPNWLEFCLSQDYQEIFVRFDSHWHRHLSLIPNGPVRVSIPRFPLDREAIAALLAELRFSFCEIASFHPQWTNGAFYQAQGTARITTAPAVQGFACAFQQEGHQLLCSRRWLAHGPWEYIQQLQDTSLVFFHDIHADPLTAFYQAQAGHLRMADAKFGGLLASTTVPQGNPPGFYVPDEYLLKIMVRDRVVSQQAMLQACRLRAEGKLDGHRPLHNIAFVFMEEEQARRHLYQLWLRALECRTLIDGHEVVLSASYNPTFQGPDWVLALASLAKRKEVSPPNVSLPPLHTAVQTGMLTVVHELLAQGEDLEARASGWGEGAGLTPLAIAAKAGNLELATLLLSHGANPETLMHYEEYAGVSALFLAAYAGQASVVALLLAHGASPNRSARNWLGATPLFAASQNGHEETVTLLLQSGALPDLPQQQGRISWTPLCAAASGGHGAVVKLLLEYGADREACYRQGATAVVAAVEEGRLAVVSLLLDWHFPAEANTCYGTDQTGVSLVYIAAACHHHEVVSLLLERGADPNKRTPSGKSPLLIAVSQNHVPTLEELYRYGADFTERTASGQSLLQYAVAAGHLETVRFLLEKNHAFLAQLDASLLQTAVSRRGDSALVRLLLSQNKQWAGRTAESLHVAARGGQVEMIALLLGHGAILEGKDHQGRTALHVAIRHGQDQVVQQLLDAGARVDAVDTRGRSPLHEAARGERSVSMQALIRVGALPSVRDHEGATPLHVAALGGAVAAVERLLTYGLPVDSLDNHGLTPLHYAAHEGHGAMVQLLLQRGASVSASAGTAMTPVHAAAQGGRVAVLAQLLDHGAALGAKDEHGFTALHLAAQSGKTEALEWLLHKKLPQEEASEQGQTALHCAAEQGQIAAVEVLLQWEAALEGRDGQGNTALHLAARQGQEQVASLLIQQGAQLDAVNGQGASPLAEAVANGQGAVVTRLLALGAKVDGQQHDGRTALHLAVNGAHLSVIKQLLRSGSQVDVPDQQGWTPLHWAADQGQLEMIELLIRAGAAVNARDTSGRTALHLAAARGWEQGIEQLLGYGADAQQRARISFLKRNMTPLQLALHQGKTEAAQQFKRPVARRIRLMMSLSGINGEQLFTQLLQWRLWGQEPTSVQKDGQTLAVQKEGGVFLQDNPGEDIVVEYGDFRNFLCLQEGRIVKLAVDGYPFELSTFLQLLSELDFELAVFASLHVDRWRKAEQGNCYLAPGFQEGHFPLGWGCALKGAGHNRVCSRRWLEHGPWQLHLGQHDTSLVQFHDMTADPYTALTQARPGHHRMGLSHAGGFLPTKAAVPAGSQYDARHRLLRVRISGNKLDQKTMREACSVRAYNLLGEKQPIDEVAFLFQTEAVARQALHELWLRDLQCLVQQGEEEKRLDCAYTPRPHRPRWARDMAASAQDRNRAS